MEAIGLGYDEGRDEGRRVLEQKISVYAKNIRALLNVFIHKIHQ
jgi:hypothetical protein